MNELNLLSASHVLTVLLSLASIVLLPKYFKKSAPTARSLFRYSIIFLLLVNQLMDFYREGLMSNNWKEGLPLHLCDFSTIAVILYFITKNREFFVFAFFFGIAGGGMSILTPDTVYGFPYIGYIQSQIGHTMILMGVSYAIIIDNQRPQLKDVHRVLGVLSVFLLLMYPINNLLGSPANYWYVAEKPPGFNVTDLMRDAPYHMIDIYILTAVICYLIYLPYFIKDKLSQK